MKDELVGKKIEFFLLKNIAVHIDCHNGRFYNGEIIEINSEKKFIIIKDRFIGETPVMFEEIENIEKMREMEE